MIPPIIRICSVSPLILSFGLTAVLVFAFAVDSRASADGNKLRLEYSEDGKLTLDAHNVKLSDLMAKICAETKIGSAIKASHRDIPISVSFQSLPLKEALKRVLNGINKTFLYHSDGRIAKVMTYPSGGSEKRVAAAGSDSTNGNGSEISMLARAGAQEGETQTDARIGENVTDSHGAAEQPRVDSKPDSTVVFSGSIDLAAEKERLRKLAEEKPQPYKKPPPEIIEADMRATSPGSMEPMMDLLPETPSLYEPRVSAGESMPE